MSKRNKGSNNDNSPSLHVYPDSDEEISDTEINTSNRRRKPLSSQSRTNSPLSSIRSPLSPNLSLTTPKLTSITTNRENFANLSSPEKKTSLTISFHISTDIQNNRRKIQMSRTNPLHSPPFSPSPQFSPSPTPNSPNSISSPHNNQMNDLINVPFLQNSANPLPLSTSVSNHFIDKNFRGISPKKRTFDQMINNNNINNINIINNNNMIHINNIGFYFILLLIIINFIIYYFNFIYVYFIYCLLGSNFYFNII